MDTKHTPATPLHKWEAVWTRYIEALKRLDEATSNPDGRVAAAARRSVRAAKRKLTTEQTVLRELGEE